MSANRAEHLTSEARARLEARIDSPNATLSNGTLIGGIIRRDDLRALLADRDAAVAALREIATRAEAAGGNAYGDFARTYLARLEPEKTDAE